MIDTSEAKLDIQRHAAWQEHKQRTVKNHNKLFDAEAREELIETLALLMQECSTAANSSDDATSAVLDNTQAQTSLGINPTRISSGLQLIPSDIHPVEDDPCVDFQKKQKMFPSKQFFLLLHDSASSQIRSQAIRVFAFGFPLPSAKFHVRTKTCQIIALWN